MLVDVRQRHDDAGRRHHRRRHHDRRHHDDVRHDDASSAPATTTTLAPVDFDDPFGLGVASGDPDATGVVLWTRLAPDPTAADGGMPGSDVSVRWEVAADASFTTILDHGDAVAGAADAHSVHVTVTLDDDAERWYRFRVGQHTSPAGAPGGHRPVRSTR